ncbi:DUF5687 domain-containing protein [Flavobacterium branchiophilum]|uniref:Uncharacterized protein n=1 Tax=Flavobacterium branchiophilum (strain FL-15) TaxID=1034807 RepID=G2Z411_FLABF|nr:DUF5687 family protein [Flavobacterium branchiophilum]CCB68346.1 Probable transmembrane protein of unknown function [Flavobacterium branchiophilum FL-15]
MYKKLLYLEWKSFSRSASFTKNVAYSIFLICMAFVYGALLLLMGIGAYYALKQNGLNPLFMVNKYLIYYLLVDLVFRFGLQKMPVVHIKQLLTLPFNKNGIVHYAIGKTMVSFFNWLHALFFIPFSIVLIVEGYAVGQVLAWHLAIMAIIYCLNFINILLDNSTTFLTYCFAVVATLVALEYYQVFVISNYTQVFFDALFNQFGLFLLPLGLAVFLYRYTFRFYKKELYLDAGLATKVANATTENMKWLDQFGHLGTFLKNDIRLIKRNKRSKTTVMMSILFLFYGILFFRENANQPQIMHIFAGLFVSGGFLFTFGQFVPSWDSQHYSFMMTQNIPYRAYLTSKWWLIVIATTFSTIVASGYIYFGMHAYWCIVAGAIYNIGINSHLVLFAGAYTKTPIDLAAAKGAFGDKKAFNVQTLLISIPKMLIPILLYALGLYLFDANTGLLLVAFAGILGFALRNRVFTQIEKVYQSEKYSTISAYKKS